MVFIHKLIAWFILLFFLSAAYSGPLVPTTVSAKTAANGEFGIAPFAPYFASALSKIWSGKSADTAVSTEAKQEITGNFEPVREVAF